MTVKELKKLLEKVDDNRIVIMSSDGEGNTYSPLADIDDSKNYTPDSTWSGDIGIEELTPELINGGYTEEDVSDGEPALILYPTN